MRFYRLRYVSDTCMYFPFLLLFFSILFPIVDSLTILRSLFLFFILRSSKTPVSLVFFFLFFSFFFHFFLPSFVGDALIPSNTPRTFVLASRNSTIRDQRLYANTLERVLRCKKEL